ncbi:hypothetical protein PR001_g11226 [Phytophthora rubi]|uniref:Uncharacterized protein n=1 Tax=Phytophthora rubi TaxID=129364 RepID=A0A6A3M967_9STRA|nr:hypothetical protein PR002_g11305 [Phytophthora rubi]KAE9030571.1 hypothetical protein PR001_g11226 [Phytophthora rubi]
MNPPTANPVLPADAPREDPSTVEALPAVLPAANPSDAGNPATAAGRTSSGLPALHPPPPASASPAIPFALRDNPDAPGDATALPASGRPSTGDVIVVDAASTPSGPESAGRTSARLRRSQGKRLGPASGASLKQRNPAMRLSGLWKWGGAVLATCTLPPSARADFLPMLVVGVCSAGIALTRPQSPSPSAPVSSGGLPVLTTVPPPALDQSAPPFSPIWLVTEAVVAPVPFAAPGHGVDEPLSAVDPACVHGTVEPHRPSDCH